MGRYFESSLRREMAPGIIYKGLLTVIFHFKGRLVGVIFEKMQIWTLYLVVVVEVVESEETQGLGSWIVGNIFIIFQVMCFFIIFVLQILRVSHFISKCSGPE